MLDIISYLKKVTMPEVTLKSSNEYIKTVRNKIDKIVASEFTFRHSNEQSQENYNTAIDYIESGNNTGAKYFLVSSISYFPNIESWYHLGTIFAGEEKYPESIIAFTEAIAIYDATLNESSFDAIPSCYFNRAIALIIILTREKQLDYKSNKDLIDFVVEDLHKAYERGMDQAVDVLQKLDLDVKK